MVKSLQSFLAIAPVGILIFDCNEKGQLVCSSSNELAERLLGLSSTVGLVWEKIMPILPQYTKSEEILYQRSPNTWIGFVITDLKAAEVVVFIKDQTFRHTKAENNEVQIADLKKSNKELEQFAYVASHDLREPLRKIRAFGERLEQKYKDSLQGDGAFYLERMKDAARRMQILIDDLLAFSRVATQDIVFKDVDLNEVLQNTLSDLETRIQNDDAIIESRSLPHVKGNSTQITQVFQNLIGNALKFKKADIPLHLQIEYQSTDKEHIIKFIDNGIGFDPKDAESIFVIFQRLHGRSEYEGTGIGLAICKKIMENHGGSVYAEGEPGKFSRFTISFPK